MTAIGSAAGGQDTAPVGTEKLPHSANKWVSIDTIAKYTRGPKFLALSALMGGVVGDARGLIAYGSTAPSGTDYTTQLQTAVTAAAGCTLLWDDAWSISAALLFPSNINIIAPNKDCGLILRANANCDMWRNAGCLGNDASTSRQNSFGKLDPAHVGNQLYRVVDPSFFANKNFHLQGGTWNCNRQQQGTGAANIFDNTNGAHCGIKCYGVDNVLIEDADLFSSQVFLIHYANCRNFVVRNCNMDQSPTAGPGIGCAQAEGPCDRIIFENIKTHCGADDNIAFNANDGSAASVLSFFGAGFALGTNWPCNGALTGGTLVDGHELTRGAENVLNAGAIRFLSTVSRIDNVTVRRLYGATSYQGIVLTQFQTSTSINGAGNFGNFLFEDIKVDFSAPAGGPDQIGFFNIDGQFDNITIRDFVAYPQNTPYIYVGNQSGGGLDNIHFDGKIWLPTGATNNAQPIMLVAGNVGKIKGKFLRQVGSGFSAVDSPVVKTATGANITGGVELEVDYDTALSVVNHNAGSLSNVRLTGYLRNAGAGRPLTGGSFTIKNTQTTGMYSVNSFVGGTLTITNANGYAD